MSIEPEDEHAERDEEAGQLPWLPPLPDQGQHRAVPVDTYLWRHCLEGGATAIAGTIFTAWILAHFAYAVPLWGVALTGLTLAFVTGYTAITVTGSVPVAGWLLAWGLVITGWLAAARLEGLWHPVLWFAILIPGLVLSVLGAPAIGHHRDEVRRAARDSEQRRNAVALRRWETLFRRLGASVTVLEEHETEDGDGRQILGRVNKPADGVRPVTFAQLAQLAPLIASSKRLPEDAVTFTRPKNGSAADFVMHLRERSGPRPDVYLPAENRPQTITRPLALGVLDSGRVFELLYREVIVIVIGVRGSGKSNLTDVFIAQLARCIDAVVFMIDLKGGRAARPWMMPWVQGDTPRPVIDWLATTREEADLMLDSLLAGIQARSRSGAGFDKIIPDADRPAVVLVVDETAVATGHGIRKDGLSNYAIAQKLAQYVELGRSEAMDAWIAALRGNVDIFGSTAVKAQSEVRIGLRVSQTSDGDSIFPDDHHAAQVLARIRDKGDGVAKIGADLSGRIHFYKISPQLIDNIGRWAGDIRPDPDAHLAAALGDAYATRWSRQHGTDLLTEWRRSAGLPEDGPRDDRDDSDPFWGLVASVEDPEARVDPRQQKMRELVRDRPQGLTVGRLVTLLANLGMTTPRETVQRWLAKDAEKGLVAATGRPLHRWIWQGGTGDLGD